MKCPRSASIRGLALLALGFYLTLMPASLAAPLCGDANGDGRVGLVDALWVAQILVGLRPLDPDLASTADVDGDGVLTMADTLLLAQFSVGLPVALACNQVRAVDTLGTTAVAPVRLAPTFASPEGDFSAVNTGEFNEVVRLGAGGNPAVLFELGQTFSVVLEATLQQPAPHVVDVAPAVTPEGTTLWSSSASAIAVSANGVLTAVTPNECATIQADFTPVIGFPMRARFAACVDLWGVDRPTRELWLPLGQLDTGLPGLPSGPPMPAVGDFFRQYYTMNTGASGAAGIHFNVNWDPAVLSATGPGSLLSPFGREMLPLYEELDGVGGRFYYADMNFYPGSGVAFLMGFEWQRIGGGAPETNARIESSADYDGNPFDPAFPIAALAASSNPAALVVPLRTAISLASAACTPGALCGDATGDGFVNIIDSLWVSQVAVGLRPLASIDAWAANVAGVRHPDPQAYIDVADGFLISRAAGAGFTLSCCP